MNFDQGGGFAEEKTVKLQLLWQQANDVYFLGKDLIV